MRCSVIVIVYNRLRRLTEGRLYVHWLRRYRLVYIMKVRDVFIMHISFNTRCRVNKVTHRCMRTRRSIFYKANVRYLVVVVCACTPFRVRRRSLHQFVNQLSGGDNNVGGFCLSNPSSQVREVSIDWTLTVMLNKTIDLLHTDVGNPLVMYAMLLLSFLCQ